MVPQLFWQVSVYIPVTICSSGLLVSFFLNTKSPNALDKAKLPLNIGYCKWVFFFIQMRILD